MNESRASFRSLLLDRWHPYFIITGVILFLYAKSLAFRYVYFDDNDLILNSQSYLSQLSNIVAAFKSTPSTFETLYRPLLTVSFILDAQWGGISPFAFHLTNILLHAGASCLVFLFFQKLEISRLRSFCLTMLFAVHPVLTQAVAWIPGRNDPLLAIGVLASFITVISFVAAGRKRFYFAHLFFFTAALFSKETAVVVPLLALLYLLLFDKTGWTKVRLLYLFAGWGVAVLCWYTLRISVPAFDAISPEEMLAPLAKGLPALMQYMGKMLFPFELAVIPTITDTKPIYGIAALLSLVVLGLLCRGSSRRYLLFGLSWMLLLLLPTMVLTNNCYFEHRTYLPLVGLLLAAGGGLGAMNTLCRSRYLPAAIIAVIFVVFSAKTFMHMDCFMNRFFFWQNAVATSPSLPQAHNNMGMIYANYCDKPQLAEQEFRKCLALAPQNSSAYLNLGIIYINQNRLNDAEEEFRKCMNAPDRHKDYPVLFYNYAGLCYERGRQGEAEAFWKKTIESAPGFCEAYRNLATMYLKQGRREEAARYAAGMHPACRRTVFEAPQPGERWMYRRDQSG